MGHNYYGNNILVMFCYPIINRHNNCVYTITVEHHNLAYHSME